MKAPRVSGPVPSRRLGKRIGINNIPPKTFSYSCVYCQLGKFLKKIALEQTGFHYLKIEKIKS